MSTQKENSIIYADVPKCIGCKKCEFACAQSHSGLTRKEAKAQNYVQVPRVHVIKYDDVKMPIQCHQCENAPCAHACPTGAIYQADGLVMIDEGRCIGCKVCVMACPFGAIEVANEGIPEEGRTNRGVAKKCDLCIDRMDEEGNYHCACVESCPKDVLSVVTATDYREQVMVRRAKELCQPASTTYES